MLVSDNINTEHNNLVKLGDAIEDLDLALQLQTMRLHTKKKNDSLSVYHWLPDSLMGIARVSTKAASETLAR